VDSQALVDSDFEKHKNTVRNLKAVVASLKEENHNMKSKLKEVNSENKELQSKL
jgi:predicted RNase H-like nuclease (RuvC/YqgF family)